LQGRRLADYELLEILGKGGMGVVYRARQTSLDRIVALKMIRSGEFASPREIQRFFAEARAVAKLRHPNIVAIHDVGEVNGQHFFSMDCIEGPALDSLIREHPLDAKRAARCMLQIAEAIEYAHQQGILR
jgi:serine/threonine protein kinase